MNNLVKLIPNYEDVNLLEYKLTNVSRTHLNLYELI